MEIYKLTEKADIWWHDIKRVKGIKEKNINWSTFKKYFKKKKYKPYEEISREFKKIKPPTFNGEIEKGEEAEAWMSGMKKYFQIYNYSN